MKTRQTLVFLAVIMFIFSCKKEEKATISETKEKAPTSVESKYQIDKDSHIIWKADKIVGGHDGTFHTSEGHLSVTDGKLVGGQAIFDIGSLKVTNVPEEDESYTKLTGHLLSADFFDAEKFPKATFDITTVKDNTITGNLTIKEISKSVSFPAVITINNDQVHLTSEAFTIDRTEWDIKYNSGKFADPLKLGDFLIKDDVAIKIDIKSTKK